MRQLPESPRTPPGHQRAVPRLRHGLRGDYDAPAVCFA
jgi:hypothetical protein